MIYIPITKEDSFILAGIQPQAKSLDDNLKTISKRVKYVKPIITDSFLLGAF